MSASALPPGWSVVELAELASAEPYSITDGPFGSKLKTEHYRPTGPRVVRLQNIGDGAFLDEEAHIDPAHFQALKRHQVFAGDLVIAALGEKLPRAAMVPQSLGPAIVKADCIRFKVDERKVSSKYLLHSLNSPTLRQQASAIIHGVGRPRMNQGEIKSLKIPLAPRPEQDRIVAEIEKQLTRLDAGVEALKRLQALLRRYRVAVMRSAVEGAGAPATTESHVRRSLELLAAARGEGGSHPASKIDDVALSPLPSGWEWATVAQVGVVDEQTVLTGPFGTALGSADFISDGIPVLTIGCLTDHGVSLEKALFVSPEKAEQLGRYRVRAGDLLFSRMASVGRAGLVTTAYEGALINYHIMRLRLEPSVLMPAFFMAYVRSSEVVQAYLRAVNHGATRPGINTEQLLMLPVPVPPAKYQEEALANMDAKLHVAHHYEVVLATSLQRASRLRASIFRAAFEGRLVPLEELAGGSAA